MGDLPCSTAKPRGPFSLPVAPTMEQTRTLGFPLGGGRVRIRLRVCPQSVVARLCRRHQVSPDHPCSGSASSNCQESCRRLCVMWNKIFILQVCLSRVVLWSRQRGFVSWSFESSVVQRSFTNLGLGRGGVHMPYRVFPSQRKRLAM